MVVMQHQLTLRLCEYCGVGLTRLGQRRFCGVSCAAWHRGSRPEYQEGLSQRAKLRYQDPVERQKVSDRQKARYANPANRPWGQVGGDLASHPKYQRAKTSRTIRKNQTWLLGGNGRPRSWRQERLAQALGWASEYVVLTGREWQPHSYKIDVAEPEMKIAIEVGNLASPRKQQWYRLNGWTYLHFTNRMIEVYLEGALATVSSTISKLREPTTM